jgi:hypothetical protein
MENITVKVNITATSNKQNSQYKTENPKKSVYITPLNDTEKAKLIDFGLVEYTPKDGGAPFFVVKSTDQIKCWLNRQVVETIPASIEDPNFKFEEGKFLSVNIIKGENVGNVFYRINAIKFENDTLMQHAYQPIEEECPF